MTPLNLEQTLSYLRERMPAPFDLPQLAHLCRTGQLTPLFSHNGKAIYYTAYFTAPAEIYVNGYLTAPALINLIDKDITLELFKGYIYKTFNDNVHLHLNNMTVTGIPVRKNGIVFVDIDYSYGWPDRGTGNFKVKITRNDLLFDLEQLESIAPAGDTQTSQRKNALAHSATDTTAHTPADDEPTHHKSIGSMTALIATLLKMAEYDKADLEQPTGEINKIIVAKAQTLGLKVEKDFIAKWLKNAYEALYSKRN